MMASKQATLLIALCALLTVAVASEQKLFAELLHDAKAGVSSRQSDYAPADVKHICLEEAKQYNCRTVGCQEISLCSKKREGDDQKQNSGPCPDCVTRFVHKSDLTCCGNSKEHAYGADGGPDGLDFNSPYLNIGTCDWDVLVPPEFACLIDPASKICDRRRADPITPDNLRFGERAGTAWGTCYLTAGAEFCDDALCGNMVLTIQGGLYLTPARSTLPQSLANNRNADDTCGPSLGDFNPLRAAAAPAAPAVKTANVGDGGEEAPQYAGVALLVSGTIKATSLDKKVEYPLGYMDYVYDFRRVDETVLAAEFSNNFDDFPVVRPNSYNIKLVAGSKKATY